MKSRIFYITAILCACCFLWGTAWALPDNTKKNDPKADAEKKVAMRKGQVEKLAEQIKIAGNFIEGAGLVQKASSDILDVLNEMQNAIGGVYSKDQWENSIASKMSDTGFISACADFKKKIKSLAKANPPKDTLKNIEDLSRVIETAVKAVALFEKTAKISDSEVLERLEQEKSPVMDIPEIKTGTNNEMTESIIVMTRAEWLKKSIDPTRKALFEFDRQTIKTARAMQSLSSSWREKSVMTEFEIQQTKIKASNENSPKEKENE